MKKIKIIAILASILCVGILFTGCNKDQVPLPTNPNAPSSEQLSREMQADIAEFDAAALTAAELDGEKVKDDIDYNTLPNIIKIDIKDLGSIYVLLRPDVAPTTVNNFKRLVLEGFYDGLIFHRIVDGLMIEGGEQDADGVIHDSSMIYGEYSDNNYTNNLKHVRGVISMSRKNLPDSASSGFFITCADAPQLDGRYAAFGYVLSGLDVVEKIESAATGANDYPVSPITIEKIQFMKEIGENNEENN